MAGQFRHKKELGQHFLKDRNIAEKIAKLGEITKTDTIWEIGPGRGILTRELLTFANTVTAFEIDKGLYEGLEKDFGSKLNLIKEDVLKADWESLYESRKLKIIANIPYQITTPLLMKMIGFREKTDRAVLMVQREVAEKLNAIPSTKEYSFLSIKAQFYFDINYEFTVKPHLFYPPPKVQSAVISLHPKKDIYTLKDEDTFWKLVDTSFRSRRKTLRNNLKYMFSKEKVQTLDQVDGLDLGRRAETFSIKEFVDLYNTIENL